MNLRTVVRSGAAPLLHMGPGFRAAGLRPGDGLDLDPFLGIDHFHMAQPFFPAHPHAGFAAVTYLFPQSKGSFRNRDSLGTDLVISPGALHWTQAGSGVVHEEVPSEPGVDGHGLQLFVNLATAQELTPPQIFHVEADQVPEHRASGALVRVLSGEALGLSAAIQPATRALLLDVHLEPGAAVQIDVPSAHAALVLAVSGHGTVSGTALAADTWAELGPDGHHLTLEAGAEGLHAVVLGGARVHSPKTWMGSFALSTVERLYEARARYARGEIGRVPPLVGPG